ncbi:hypothetical protein UMZ34_06525 [Halopseudomonas pachastrellae]|nr:hypothetical protein UMZ34_06525 [Halopseudomonas pachastrellae]
MRTHGRARHWLAAALLVGGGALALPLSADQTEDARAARAELEKAQADIERLKEVLSELRQEAPVLEAELKESETDIGRLQRESGELEQQIRDGESRLQDLHKHAEQLQALLDAQQEQIRGGRCAPPIWQGSRGT